MKNCERTHLHLRIISADLQGNMPRHKRSFWFRDTLVKLNNKRIMAKGMISPPCVFQMALTGHFKQSVAGSYVLAYFIIYRVS